MLEFLKKLVQKEETFSCIVFDGKTMKYLKLTQKEIDKLKLENKDWVITKQEGC